MVKHLVILVLASLLILVVSGCTFQLIEAPRAQEGESVYLATEPADILGVWEHAFMGSTVLIEYTPDGELVYYLGSPPAVSFTGEYWFEDDKLHFAEEYAGMSRVGIYTVQVKVEDGVATELMFTAVDDPEPLRQSDYELGVTRTELPSED